MAAFGYTFKSFLREVLMIILGVLMALPFYLLIVISLKTEEQVANEPLVPPFADPQWGNYVTAWLSGDTAGGLGQAFLSTVVITVGSVACIVIVAGLAGYVLARRTSRMSSFLYVLFVVGFILPITLGLVPLYVAMRALGLLGTYHGMILLHTAGMLPFAVFLYTGFIRALPAEFEEAAQMDGAGLWRRLFRVVFPLLRPITTTVAILCGLVVWNDFFMALIFLSGSSVGTLPVALNSFVNEYAAEWHLIFAGATIALLPALLVFIIAQKQFVHGFSGGIRG